MTAEQIRDFTMNTETGREYRQIVLLGEIAAQLAELNAHLRAKPTGIQEFRHYKPAVQEPPSTDKGLFGPKVVG